VKLSAPTGVSLDGFNNPKSVRELSDGRLMVASGSDPLLCVVDFATGASVALSRRGDGPGEFRDASRLYRLSGDSTVLEDRQGLRWIVFDGARPIHTWRSWGTGFNGPWIVGFDDRGRMLELRGFAFGRAPNGPQRRSHADAESLWVLVHHRSAKAAEFLDGRIDTLVVLRGWSRGVTTAQAEAKPGFGMEWWITNPLSTEEQALLFPDGWIAIVRMQPYRVQWRTPDGSVIEGPPLPFERVEVSATQKRYAISRRYPPPKPAFEPEAFAAWPEILPAIQSGAATRDALFGLPDGRLAVLRTSDARLPGNRYDIVDRSGRLSARLVLAENERVLGFGAQAVYVAVSDEDGLEVVRRHVWP
jgi:hypothetical protein